MKRQKLLEVGFRFAPNSPETYKELLVGIRGSQGVQKMYHQTQGVKNATTAKWPALFYKRGSPFRAQIHTRNTKSDRSSLVTVTGSSISVHAKNVMDSMLVNPKQNLKLDIQTTSKRLRTRPGVLATTKEGWGAVAMKTCQ